MTKQPSSTQLKKAISLVRYGTTIRKAAELNGISYSTLYSAMSRNKKSAEEAVPWVGVHPAVGLWA